MKEKILKLCDDMVFFWMDLKFKISSINDNDDYEIINTWEEFFPAHAETITELSKVKNMIDKR